MHYFFLGNTPALSTLEINSLYKGAINSITGSIASYDGELELASLSRLGGTTKVAIHLDSVSPAELQSRLTTLMRSDPGGKNMAVTSFLPEGEDSHLSLSQIKQDLVATRKTRFVSMNTTPHELIMLKAQHVCEYNLLSGAGEIIIAKTVWIHDAKDWISRDRNKPFRDIKRGMLPPKLARIMLNVATLGKTGLVIADPFCGTGTILAEAMLLGCHTRGGDTSPSAVSGTKNNLSWIASSPNAPQLSFEVYLSDATHFDQVIAKCDCLVTEPYMGPLLDERNASSLTRIKNVAKGLDKLYRGTLNTFHSLLPVGGRVVISFPSFNVYHQTIQTISIDTITSLGYNYISSVPYGKPGAIVTRNITILEKV